MKARNFLAHLTDAVGRGDTAAVEAMTAGLDPATMQPVYVAKTREEKAMQRALMQCHVRKNWPLIRKALRMADREDLIGTGRGCLVPPDHLSSEGQRGGAGQRSQARGGRSAKRGAKGGGRPSRRGGG